ncbi:MAG: hypothetical protein M3136_13650 [Thermoproteota archaeon]|jgi:hypothetical protein|nr:hypothetical protein [Thermoproteota archaeon]
MQQQGNLIKKGHFYFIYDNDLNFVLEDKTKRGLEVRENVFDEKLSIQADKGMIYDLNGIGHKVGIRWYFPKSKYRLDHVIKIGEEMELRYKKIREMTCPDDE